MVAFSHTSSVLLVTRAMRSMPRGSSQIARYGETVFLHGGGYEETLQRVHAGWRATMRLAGPVALYRSAANLVRFEGRAILKSLAIPRTYLYPAADGPLKGADALTAAGVRVVALPHCGHNITLDNPAGFVDAVLAAEAAAAVPVPRAA